MNIAQNLKLVRWRIAEAAKRSGRDPESIKLIAVTKGVSADAMICAFLHGVTHFGENRVQEARDKFPLVQAQLGQGWQGLTLHMIGHLQRNKVGHALKLFHTIQSVDSERLLVAIDRKCAEMGRRVQVLLQVNVSGELTKAGFKPEELPAVLESASKLTHVEVTGLMTIAPFTQCPEEVRPVFAKLRELTQLDPARLRELSMGMSGDFEVAVEEGATMVRIGTAIFGPRCYTRGEDQERLGMDFGSM
ncbi:MAG: YggS family pyridoxal phosphate-dependent enzyme [Bacillota bacterium]